MPKISLIVPVYNVEKYLRRCLESVINQSETDIEIIIVNDCSTDNSEEIILEYLSKDKRIKYIKHKENIHVGGARNTGVAAATGEYIWYIDSDDWIDISACELLYNTAKAKELDLLKFECVEVRDGIIQPDWVYGVSRVPNFVGKIYKGKELFKIKMSTNSYANSAWRCILKKELALAIPFATHASYQDADWTIKTYLQANKSMHLRYAPYYYRAMREGSTMTATYDSIFVASVNHFKLLNRIIEDFLESDDEEKTCALMLVDKVLQGWWGRISPYTAHQDVSEHYQSFLGNYEKLTGKVFIPKRNATAENNAENILNILRTSSEIRQMIKIMRKKYWQIRRENFYKGYEKLKRKFFGGKK